MRIKSLLAHHKNEPGFTILEMTVVMLLLGSFFAALSQLYIQFTKTEQFSNTETNLASAVNAIAQFRSLNGHYPCPASLRAVRGDAEYGRETDCTNIVDADFQLDQGVTAAGVAVVAGQFPNTRVRVGALPFKSLNMEEDFAYDGYKQRLMYAVTEVMATNDGFSSTGGAIEILDDSGGSALDVPGTAHFIIFSLGENGAGSFSYRGLSTTPCPADAQASENCNYTADSVFLKAEREAPGNNNLNQYDDHVIYAIHSDNPMWEAEGDNNQHVSTLSTGNLGINMLPNQDPQQELEIAGVIRSQDDPLTEDNEEGQFRSNTICGYNDDIDCFSSDLIAGQLENGGGMQCPQGQFMTGIRNNEPVCQNELEVRCPPGSRIIGIEENGSLICDEAPIDCPTAQVEVCGETHTLFQGRRNNTRLVEAGYSRQVTYRCLASGTWGQPRSTGICTCNPYERTHEYECGQNTHCGMNYSGGTRQRISGVRDCDIGWQVFDEGYSACTCVEDTRERIRQCPQGYNRGEITQRFRGECNNNVHQCQWDGQTSTCACAPETQTRWTQCPANLNGQYEQQRNFNCPNGEGNPGSWGQWEEVPGSIDEHCDCQPFEVIDHSACPDGFIGTVLTTRTRACPGGEETVVADDSACEPAPVRRCFWTWRNSTNAIRQTSGQRQTGNECECEELRIRSCTRPLNQGQFETGHCSCE